MAKRYKQCGIYCYHNMVNGKNYVGQSIDLAKRRASFGIENHIYSGIAFQNAINKYGKENFQYSVLTHCKPCELNYWESFYISRLKSNDGKHGYNCTSGGDSFYKISDETKELIKKNRFVKNYGIEYDDMKKKVTEYVVNNNLAGYTDISEYFSITHKYASKICHEIGYTTDIAIDNFLKKQKKTIIQCDRNNHDIVLNVFESLSDAERITGIHSIKHCVEGKQYSAGGYYWEYSENSEFTGQYNEEYLMPTNDRRKLTDGVKQILKDSGLYVRESLFKKVFCYDKNGLLVKIYESVSSVSEDGFNKALVSCCCNPKQTQRTHKDYVFSYNELSKDEVLSLFRKKVKKPVIQTTLDGAFIKKWESGTLAAKKLGLLLSNINACCHGKHKTCGGYKWSFSD